MSQFYDFDLQGRPVYALDENEYIGRMRSEQEIRAINNRRFDEKFVIMRFDKDEKLFQGLSNETLTRLMYAATFCKEDNSIMSRQLLKKQMKLSDTAFTKFLSECYQHNILSIKDHTLYINDEYFFIGSLRMHPCESKRAFIRLFIGAIRSLYESSRPSDHRWIAYLFRAIPYLNRFTNAFNPLNSNTDLGKPTTDREQRMMRPVIRFGEFCEVTEFDKKHSRTLLNRLLKLRIGGQSVICFLVFDIDPSKWFMVINPCLFFGADHERYDVIVNEFKLKEDYERMERLIEETHALYNQ